MKGKMKQKIGLYIFYLIICIFFLFPLLWLLSLSFKTVPELFENPPQLIPNSFSLDNYKHVMWTTNMFRYLKNSLIYCGFTIVGAMLLSVPAAYAFSRFRFRGKRTLMFAVLFFQMISPLIVVIPGYRYFSSMGWLNNFWALIAVYIALTLPFSTWSLKGYVDTIPIELDESAFIDGCGRIKTLIKIVAPLIVPGVVSVVILVFVRTWSQFIVPYILLNDQEMFPISVALVNLQSTSDAITTHYLAAAGVIAILPTLLVFILLQKFIVSAMTAGAVKG